MRVTLLKVIVLSRFLEKYEMFKDWMQTIGLPLVTSFTVFREILKKKKKKKALNKKKKISSENDQSTGHFQSFLFRPPPPPPHPNP